MNESEEELPKLAIKVITQLREDGFSERNIKALFSFQKGRFDAVFRPVTKALPTRIYTGKYNDKMDLVITTTFEKESDKTAFTKIYTDLNFLMLAWSTQKANGIAKLSDFVSAKAALHNGTAKVETKERKIVTVEISEDEL